MSVRDLIIDLGIAVVVIAIVCVFSLMFYGMYEGARPQVAHYNHGPQDPIETH